MKITFISTYPPIVCGIASYLEYITAKLPEDSYQVISFKLRGLKIIPNQDKEQKVHYIIPHKNPNKAIRKLNQLSKDTVVWIQHSFGMWPKDEEFIEFISRINAKKIITFHTIHFQSDETHYGIQEREYNLLKKVLPLSNAVTLFSDGAYFAVAGAFPEYQDKIVVIRHGFKVYPRIGRAEARHKMMDYLINCKGSRIGVRLKKQLKKLDKIFYKQNTLVIGNIGFITTGKGVEFIYQLRDELSKIVTNKKIIAMYIGTVRDPHDKIQMECRKQLKKYHNGKQNFFIDHYIPEDMMLIFLASLDVHIFWPRDCTQSGRLSHLQGAAGCAVGKDLEGLGEMLKLSAYPAIKSYAGLTNTLQLVLSNRDYRKLIGVKGRVFARRFNWRKQAGKHLKLADLVKKNRKKLLKFDLGFASYLYEA